MRPDPAPAELLWFVAPGLVHLLGNTLFAVHGRLRLLTADATVSATDRTLLLDGTERAQAALLVLRWLAGGNDDAPRAAAAILRQVEEVLRVPLRDRGLLFECSGTGDGAARVPAGPFCRLVVAGSRLVAVAAAAGAPASVVLTWTVDDRVTLRWSLRAARGGLPFALDHAGLAAALAGELEAAGATAPAAGRGQPFELNCPVVAASLK